MREFARVLKPGGHLILTFVNNNNLVHRLMYLMTGAVIHNTIGPPFVCLPEAEEPAAHFRYPMSIAHIDSAVESVGMKISGIQAISWSAKSMLLAPMWVFPALGRVMAPRHYRERDDEVVPEAVDPTRGERQVAIGPASNPHRGKK